MVSARRRRGRARWCTRPRCAGAPGGSATPGGARSGRPARRSSAGRAAGARPGRGPTSARTSTSVGARGDVAWRIRHLNRAGVPWVDDVERADVDDHSRRLRAQPLPHRRRSALKRHQSPPVPPAKALLTATVCRRWHRLLTSCPSSSRRQARRSARVPQGRACGARLGQATYASHEGERPIAITWRLHHRPSGDLFAEFAAAVA